MAATRGRFGAMLEWAFAAAVMAAAVTAGSALFREFRTVRAVVPVIAGEAHLYYDYYDAPADIPPRSVSVPMLLLTNGGELRIGDRASDVAARIGDAVTVVSESIERSDFRERLTRFYNDVGVQFAVVFEAFGQDAEPKIAAIYLR